MLYLFVIVLLIVFILWEFGDIFGSLLYGKFVFFVMLKFIFLFLWILLILGKRVFDLMEEDEIMIF